MTAAEFHQQQLEQQQQLEEQLKVYQIKPAYCDFIARKIKQAINTGSVKFDLDEDGALRSTMKTLFVADRNGKQYKITVEEL